jgi:KDO2-lipid IV(A) lauroyltransferase
VALLPEATARALGRAVAQACWHLSPRRRTRLMQNLKRLVPDLDARALGRTSRAAFAGFGESVVDTLRLSSVRALDVEQHVRFEGWERLEEGLADGGVILLGAHAGNWEWAGAALGRRGVPVAAPVRRHRGADRFFGAFRKRFGVRTHGRLAPLLTRDEEPRARALALFLDRAAFGRATARPARLALGAAALAARRGWSLLPALCLREGARYRIVFGPRLRPSSSREARVHDARAALAFLETQLRAHRGQWFAFESLES